jgi:hypothetical protein
MEKNFKRGTGVQYSTSGPHQQMKGEKCLIISMDAKGIIANWE